MAIQQGDIKLVTSAVMDDVPEGGGAPTSHVIEDNKSNEIFKDISESDRARGRLNMAKTFVSVQTQDTDTFLGANVVVAKPPEDPNVSITMFTTDNVYDTRTEAQARLEAYLNKGAEWAGFLYENHIAGQRTIQLFQRPNAPLPTVGKTLVLVANEGLSNQFEQYVRAIRVGSEIRTFTESAGGSFVDYDAAVVTIELSDALRNDHVGSSATRAFTRKANASKVRDTVVADAASYVGVAKLSEPVNLGDFTIRVDDTYSPLVPSSQVETPIVASSPYAQAGTPKGAGQTVAFVTNQGWSTTTNLLLPGGCLPGTLVITTGGSQIVDKGGVLMNGDQQVGTIDYANGILTSTVTNTSSKSISYQPAAYMQRFPQSMDVQVTAESRAQNYTGFISPQAVPGTLSLSYQVQGTWYVLTDAGDGTLRGYDASYGAGTYNQNDGSFVVTLGALPDVGSSLVFQWGVPTQEFAHPSASVKLAQTVNLGESLGEVLNPAFIQATWLEGSTTKTATVQTNGTITGDATGSVDLNSHEITICPNTIPVYGTEINYEYSVGPQAETTIPYPARDLQGKLPVEAGATNLLPGSVVLQWNTVTDLTVLGLYNTEQLRAMGITPVDPIHTARDDGAGNIVYNGATIGTVNYATGAVLFNPDTVARIPRPNYSSQLVSGSLSVSGDSRMWRLNYGGIVYVNAATIYPPDESGWVKIKYHTEAGTQRVTKTEVFKPNPTLVPGVSAPVVPGSVVLTTNYGNPWSDSGNGILRELSNGAWIERGTVDYVTGKLQVTSWPAGISNSVTRVSTLTTQGENVSSAYVFRTASAPLRPGSLSLQFAAEGGGTTIVTATTDGVISGAGITGSVDYQTGLVRVGFGSVVTAAGNEAEPWYDASRVIGGLIFKPRPVAGSTLKYTAVAYSYMPLDADLIGIDPVRLPSDGRVPIFRNGSMVVIGNTKTSSPITPSNGMTVDLARVRLSRALVRDRLGKAVYTGYTVDLEAGTLTFTDVAGMDTPVVIEDRIEDMLVARDVQISGQMTFTRQVTHAYPTSGTYVSSALEYGDRKARVSLVFDQATWGAGRPWKDAVEGDVAAGTYNTVLSPIEVTNAGASTERWALRFTSTTAFEVIGEHVGVIATGDINSVCAPVNPATGYPYFTVRPLGWGTGWAVGNIVRINTVGALCPVWIVRTIQPGPEAGINYSFDILARGDVDRP